MAKIFPLNRFFKELINQKKAKKINRQLDSFLETLLTGNPPSEHQDILSEIALNFYQIKNAIFNSTDVEDTVKELSLLESYLQNLKSRHNFDLNHWTLIVSGVIYLIFHTTEKGLSQEEIYHWVERFSVIFDEDQISKNKILNRIYNKKIVHRLFPNCLDVCIIETKGIQSLNTIFFEELSKKYRVKYLEKKQYVCYYNTYNLLLRAYSQAAKVVITSGSLNHNMIGNRPLVNAWHGLGLMKKTKTNFKKFRVGTMICSSRGCAMPYAEHFHVPRTEVFPLGSIQTDDLCNSEYIAKNRTAIREHYQIPEDATVVFFGPTFRIGDPNYYNFFIDIDDLSKELKNRNIYVLAKKHHVFNQILATKGIDTSGLKNSSNGHFIIEEKFSFLENLCAADTFLTDYSSGMFQALILNLPIVLYCPDWQEYKTGPNGFMIDYPSEVPAPCIESPDIDSLINGILKAKEFIESEAYQNFKYHHVGACDGKSVERIIQFIEDRYL